jgi:hypothetical protein
MVRRSLSAMEAERMGMVMEEVPWLISAPRHDFPWQRGPAY